MPDYHYEARDVSGHVSSGTIAARDTADAAVKVRALGVYPTRIATGAANGASAAAIKSIGKSPSSAENKILSANPAKIGKQISRMQILLFTRAMADLLDAGLPMDRAFSVMIDQTDQANVSAMLSAMQGDIRAGQPLSDALRKYPREFPNLFTNMVHAGEVSGQLAPVMARLAEFMEKEQVRRSQIMAALTYPMVLIAVALLAVVFLLTFVIPKLAPIFHDMGNALPLPTVMLLGLSRFFTGPEGIVLVLALAAAGFGFAQWLKTPSGRLRFDTVRLEAPMVGLLVQKIVAARLARTLGTLLGGGVPILESLDISASALGNQVATEALLASRSLVRQGETLHGAMEKSGSFLPVVLHMTAVGEETGRLPNMLLRTADTLDFEVDNAMRRLTSLVEPLVVLLMGVFIGFVVLSILLPIFQVSSLAR